MKAPPPFIAAFDLAGKTGVCDGVAGGVPRFWSWDLFDAGPFRAPRFAMLETLLHNYFSETKVDQAYYEAPQPLQVMARIGTTDATMTQLRGYVAVLELTCFKHKISCAPWEVKDARQMVLGARTFRAMKTTTIDEAGKVKVRKTSGAKPAVVETCRLLGHAVANDNEGDAVVGWLYQSARLKPHFSDSMMPLFRGTTDESIRGTRCDGAALERQKGS